MRMLTKEGCAHRIKKIWDNAGAHVDCIVLSDPKNINYFSAFYVSPFSMSAHETNFLVLHRDGRSILFTDTFSLNFTVMPFFVDEIKTIGWYDQRRSAMDRNYSLLQEVNKNLVTNKKERTLFENSISMQALRPSNVTTMQAEDLNQKIRNLRIIKGQDEIDLLKSGLRLSKTGHEYVKNSIQSGKTEFELYHEIFNTILEQSKQPVIVYGDFRASTKDNPKVGGRPTDYTITNDDLYILDYSIVLQGYRSDTTSTTAVDKPTSKQREIYSVCKEALTTGETMLRPDMPARDVFNAMKNCFAGHGYPDALPHHGGHGIGLDHLEPPFITPESDDLLETGNVITLEPGIYEKGIGGVRLEHNYLITPSGYQRLSDHPIEL